MEKYDSLKKVRKMLKRSLAEKNIETDTSLKKCLHETIAEVDREIAKNKGQPNLYMVLKLLGKTIDKLPWIVSLLEKLK